MEVGSGSTRLDLCVDHASQADAQRGQIRRKHFRVGDQCKVRPQALGMVMHKLGNPLAAHLLLAFQDHANIQR